MVVVRTVNVNALQGWESCKGIEGSVQRRDALCDPELSNWWTFFHTHFCSTCFMVCTPHLMPSFFRYLYILIYSSLNNLKILLAFWHAEQRIQNYNRNEIYFRFFLMSVFSDRLKPVNENDEKALGTHFSVNFCDNIVSYQYNQRNTSWSCLYHTIKYPFRNIIRLCCFLF